MLKGSSDFKKICLISFLSFILLFSFGQKAEAWDDIQCHGDDYCSQWSGNIYDPYCTSNYYTWTCSGPGETAACGNGGAFSCNGFDGVTGEPESTTCYWVQQGYCIPPAATCDGKPVGTVEGCTSSANSCGMTNSGTRTCQSNGSWSACSASAPSSSSCPACGTVASTWCSVGNINWNEPRPWNGPNLTWKCYVGSISASCSGNPGWVWNQGSWNTSNCSTSCQQTRSVLCVDAQGWGNVGQDYYCSGAKPSTSGPCANGTSCNDYNSCTPSSSCSSGTCTGTNVPVNGTWSGCGASATCSATCGGTCIPSTPPVCSVYSWYMGNYGSCSTTCGTGTQTRVVNCRDQFNNIVSDANCTGTKPSTSQSCTNNSGCITPSAYIEALPNAGPLSAVNTGVNIHWWSSNASSCQVSPAGWTGLSGTQPTGAIPFPGRTYTVSCLSSTGSSATANVSVTVSSLSSYSLTVIKSGEGTVAGTLSCGAGCTNKTVTLNEGDPVNLTATANPGRVFTGWSGSCAGTVPCSFSIGGNATVYANFAVDPSYSEF